MPAASFSRRAIPSAFGGLTAGDYIAPLGLITTAARTPSTSATVSAWPFHFAEPTPIDRIRMYLVTQQAGAEARYGFYTNSKGRPASLILDAGTVDLSTGTGTDKDTTVAVTLYGRIWLLIWVKNVATQATIQGAGATSVFAQGLGPGMASPVSTALFSWLTLTDTYPGSMPATAPAMAMASSGLYPLAYLRAG